jgi:hypothetical protein
MSILSQMWKGSIAVSTIVITTLSLNGCQPKHSGFDCLSPKHPLSLGTTPSTNIQPLVQTMSWQSVAIAGMGFVTGLVIHPQEPDLIYVRTDVGGVYRWKADKSSWEQLLDGERDRYSIESIALDSNNPNVIYAATGAYTRDSDGEVLKSVNRAKPGL